MAPPAKKSRTGLFVGLGCGCLVVVGCILGAIVMAVGGVMGFVAPGEEVASTPITFGEPFVLTYEQSGSQKYEAWLELDLEFSQEYQLIGKMVLNENEAAFGQYSLKEDGEGSPVEERRSSKRVEWWMSGPPKGRASGKTALFPIPARTPGSQMSLSGTIEARPGTTGTIRLFVSKRK